MEHRFEGTHEVDIQHEGSVTSISQLILCTKKHCHNLFVPFTTFMLHHLPIPYRNKAILDVINILAYLSVKLEVSFTSYDRPEFYHNTNRPYPFGTAKGSSQVRTGSGRIGITIREKRKPNRTCPCKACTNSGNSVEEWGIIRIITSVHVVYDATEALHTTCRFGYDSPHSAAIFLEVIGMERADVNDDRCHVTCVTHDMRFISDVNREWIRYPAAHRKVNEIFDSPKHRLVVIVSHPHGLFKHVSVGEWISKDHVSDSPVGHTQSKYTYTTPTCPGSSGATIYAMGRKWGFWFNQTHCGYNGVENFSGSGCD